MNIDWHKSQNTEYLLLLQQRLKQPRLIWVDQFVEIINNWIIESSINSSFSINEFGCNVGHFFRGLMDIKLSSDYTGYDISDTYLTVARNAFPNGAFRSLDISDSAPEKYADVSIISATLEHINDHEAALRNIFDTTRKLVILRTFLGDIYSCESCYKNGASSAYIIKQFTLDEIVSYPKKFGWSQKLVIDNATDGVSKFVCNSKSIMRSQKIIIFSRAD
jgi:SAM-dependent methyltransferase